MLPGLVAGGVTTLGVRQFASPALAARFAAGRLGVSGATNGIAAAGQSYLRTENLIRAAEAAGDTERAQSIRRFQDLHALLTAGLSMASERISPLQKLAPGGAGTGVRGALTPLVKEAAENPFNNMIQGTLVDPLIGEHPDVVGEAPSDFLSGLMTAGVMKTGETTVGGVSKVLERPAAKGGFNPSQRKAAEAAKREWQQRGP